MRISGWILTAVMAATLALVGCSKQDGAGTASSVDTSALESKFQSAEATVKASADKAVAAIKSADYSGAVAELKKLGENAKLTPEQQQAIKDVIAQVEKAITEAASKATGQATKAVNDATKALPKQ
jgi:hypothetical protein